MINNKLIAVGCRQQALKPFFWCYKGAFLSSLLLVLSCFSTKRRALSTCSCKSFWFFFILFFPALQSSGNPGSPDEGAAAGGLSTHWKQISFPVITVMRKLAADQTAASTQLWPCLYQHTPIVTFLWLFLAAATLSSCACVRARVRAYLYQQSCYTDICQRMNTASVIKRWLPRF